MDRQSTYTLDCKTGKVYVWRSIHIERVYIVKYNIQMREWIYKDKDICSKKKREYIQKRVLQDIVYIEESV